jgi:uncharacterized protein YbjT (DUF2867 family)
MPSKMPRTMRQPSTIAVIGGTGFIGRQIVEALARQGVRIKVLARNADRAKFLKPMGEVGQISIISGSALDDAALDQVMSGCNAVINTIGILSESRTQRFESLQAELPARIGQRAAQNNMSAVVHLSAIGVDLNSSSRYAQTKAKGEAALRESFPDAIILRPSLVFGAGDGFFNRFATMAVMAPGLPLIGGGTNKVQPVYVGDVAAAVASVLANPKAKGKTYELGGPAVMRFRDAMAYILKQTKRRRLLIPVPHAVMNIAASAMAILPNPPVTRDQLKLLKVDNVVAEDALGLRDLGIDPTPIELIVPSYLERYQPGGRFA